MANGVYNPTLSGDRFQEALRMDRHEAKLMLIHEAYCISQFVKRVLRNEGFGLFSIRRHRRRRELFAQANRAVMREAGDLGPFIIDLFLGSIEVRDIEAEEARRLAKLKARLDEPCMETNGDRFFNTRTGQVRTAEQKNMDILFGRAQPDEFQRSGQSS